MAIKETRDHIIEVCRSGRAVKVEGFGRFEPIIDLDGQLAISFRADPVFAYGLNRNGEFEGSIINRENIGMTSDQLVQIWNDNHPEDQVISPEN